MNGDGERPIAGGSESTARRRGGISLRGRARRRPGLWRGAAQRRPADPRAAKPPAQLAHDPLRLERLARLGIQPSVLPDGASPAAALALPQPSSPRRPAGCRRTRHPGACLEVGRAAGHQPVRRPLQTRLERLGHQRQNDRPAPVPHSREVVHGQRVPHQAVGVDPFRRRDRIEPQRGASTEIPKPGGSA